MSELRVPAKEVPISRKFCDYYHTYMSWGEPDHAYAVKAMQMMHSKIDYYREKARQIRLKGMKELAPEVLGLAMRSRLSKVQACICLLLNASSEYVPYFETFEPSCKLQSPAYIDPEVLNLTHCTNDVVGFRNI